MARFKYKAVNADGEVVEGVLEAGSREQVIERLKGEGNVPIRADEMAPEASSGPRRSLRISRKVTSKDITMLTRQLATLLRAKLPIDRALAILRDMAPDGPVRSLVDDTLESVRGGATMADTIAKHEGLFPSYFVGMVRAGEAGGALDTVFTRLADTLARAENLRESVKSALTYPAIVLLMALGSLVVLFIYVIPEFRPLFEQAGGAIPLSTQVIFWVSDAAGAYGVWALVILLLVLLAIRADSQRPEGRLRWDAWLLGLPLLGDLIVKVEVSRFARVLAMLLSNGVSMLNALSIAVETTANRAVGQRLSGLGARISKGEALAGALSQAGLFPNLAVQLIHAGEESGELEDMLFQVAEIFDGEVERSIQRMLSLLVPAVTIGLGVLVAGIIGSILVAILGTYDVAF